MKREDLLVDANSLDLEAMLHDWRWLVGLGRFTLVIATALGDLFLADEQGAVHFLDTLDGQFTRVASSPEDLQKQLTIRAKRDHWLQPITVQLAYLEGIRLGPGQCIGWKIPPILGAKAEVENQEPTDLLVHHSILGQVFRQVRESKK